MGKDRLLIGIGSLLHSDCSHLHALISREPLDNLVGQLNIALCVQPHPLLSSQFLLLLVERPYTIRVVWRHESTVLEQFCILDLLLEMRDVENSSYVDFVRTQIEAFAEECLIGDFRFLLFRFIFF